MSDEGLRAALEASLLTLPQMVHLGNDYPTQALPKAELLDLLAMNPPSRICGNLQRSFGVDLSCRKPIGHDGEHQDVHGATWTLLPHLTDDGAAAPPADKGAGNAPAAESATTAAAPSSPHLSREAVMAHYHSEFCEYDGMEDGVEVCAGECREFVDAIGDPS